MSFILGWFNTSGRAKEVTNPPTLKRDPYGLHVLYPVKDGCGGPSLESDVDIIAVHGLDGDPWETWTDQKSGKLWLKDFLPLDLPRARVMTFGYNSGIPYNNSVATIEDFAIELLTRVRMEHNKLKSDVERPLIFVCHSLGGIVVKKALILAHEDEERFGFIEKTCKGIMFLGTPHQGSGAADLAKILTTVINTLTLSMAIPRTALINDLRSDSGVLQTISRQFVRRVKNLEIISFYETEPLGQGALSVLTVDRRSASLGIPNEHPMPMNANHHNMCKFSNTSCQKYTLVQSALVEMAQKHSKPRKSESEIRQDNEPRLKIIEWLESETFENDSGSPKAIYLAKLNEKQNGTCEWFWENNVVKNWREKDKDSSILWVHGPPGVGKSVLCSSILSKLIPDCDDDDDDNDGVDGDSKKSIANNVAYFFCIASQRVERSSNGTAPKPNTPESIIRSLIVQLIRGNPNIQIHTKLKELCKEYKKSCPNYELKRVLRLTLNALPRAYIIIDGLDELNELGEVEPTKLKRLFQEIQFRSVGVIKWLFISQKTEAVREYIAGFRDSVCHQEVTSYRELDLGDAQIKPILMCEILEMIRRKIKRSFSGLPENLESYIVKRSISLTEGNFLCAKLLLDDLCGCPSIEDVEEAVMNHKPGLHNVYIRALRSMVVGKSASWITAVKRTLKLVTFALKPLEVSEVQVALGVSVSVIGQCGKFGMLPEKIECLCLPLIRVCPEKKTMVFVHQNVRTFLLKKFENSKYSETSGIDDVFMDERRGHTDMALVCLSYLSDSRYSTFNREITICPSSRLPGEETNEERNIYIDCDNPKDIFLKYAAIFWHRHADAAEPTTDLVDNVTKFLRSPSFIACLRVQSLHAPYHFGTFISSDGTSVAYADTVPGWLETSECHVSEGKELAFQYYSFVKEWGHVLGRYPGEIERCLIGTLGDIFFPQTEAVADAYFLSGEKMVQCSDIELSNFTSGADLNNEGLILSLKSKDNDWNSEKHGLQCTESKTFREEVPRTRLPKQTLELWRYNRKGKPIPELQWLLPDLISVTSEMPLSGTMLFNCCEHLERKVANSASWPSQLSPLIASEDLGYAIINGCLFRLCKSMNDKMHTLGSPLIEFQFTPVLCTPLGICLGTYGNYIAVGATWDCGICEPKDDEILEGDDDGSSEAESDSDSDAGTCVEIFPGAAFITKTISYAYYKLVTYDSSKSYSKITASSREFHGHCRVADGEHLFHHASPTFHPTHPLVAWAPGYGEIIVADLCTGESKRVRTAKMSRASTVVTRNLHFSKCGDLLYEIKITISTADENMIFNSGRIFLTTYPVGDPSSPDNEIQHFRWRIKRPVSNGRVFKPPTITWRTDSVYVSFSNTGLSVCRIDLLREGAKLFMARTDVALPTSALQRSVHFDPTGDRDAIVALAGSAGHGPSLISAKDLLSWDEREWYSKIDLSITGGGRAGVFYERDEATFTVAVRSGVIWTERTVLECG